MDNWVLTDVDSYQNSLQISENEFQLVELREVGDKEIHYWCYSCLIDIKEYSDKEIYEYVTTFGYENVDSIKEIYGEEWQAIITECIFESLSSWDYDWFGECKTRKEAREQLYARMKSIDEYYKNFKSVSADEPIEYDDIELLETIEDDNIGNCYHFEDCGNKAVYELTLVDGQTIHVCEECDEDYAICQVCGNVDLSENMRFVNSYDEHKTCSLCDKCIDE